MRLMSLNMYRKLYGLVLGNQDKFGQGPPCKGVGPLKVINQRSLTVCTYLGCLNLSYTNKSVIRINKI